jgi:uncharacterized protein
VQELAVTRSRPVSTERTAHRGLGERPCGNVRRVSRRLGEYVAAPLRQIASLRRTAHRPWPRPSFPWVMGQSWLDLLFLHWPVPAEQLRPHVPAALELDVRDGRAWLGITPFEVAGFQLVASPPVPKLSTFPELNVRTYVTYGGRPGIWFLSLDAASRLAVAAARRFYRLPYFRARMSAEPDGQGFAFRSERVDARGRPAAFAARYEPQGEQWTPPAGSLEAFLVERYCLYAVGAGGALLRADVHHPPWRLRRAAVGIAENTMPPPGIALSAEPPLAHAAARQDVLVWRPETCRA